MGSHTGRPSQRVLQLLQSGIRPRGQFCCFQSNSSADNSPITTRPNAFDTQRSSALTDLRLRRRLAVEAASSVASLPLKNSSHLPLANISKRFRNFSWLTNQILYELSPQQHSWQEQKQLPPSCSLNVGFGSRIQQCHSHDRSAGTAKTHWHRSHHSGPSQKDAFDIATIHPPERIYDGWRLVAHIRDFQWKFLIRNSCASRAPNEALSILGTTW